MLRILHSLGPHAVRNQIPQHPSVLAQYLGTNMYRQNLLDVINTVSFINKLARFGNSSRTGKGKEGGGYTLANQGNVKCP